MGFLAFLRKRRVAKLPALRRGRGWTFDVVGESQYQDRIARIVGGKTPEGHNHKCDAILRLATGNKSDPPAVQVEIAGRIVGYLSRENAAVYRAAINIPAATCGAKVCGGWDLGPGDTGSFGVKLNLRWPPAIDEGQQT